MKKSVKYIIPSILLLVLSSQALAASQAQTIADIANGLIPQLSEVGGLLEALCYIFGVALGIKGILKLKEYNETKGQQIGISSPLWILFAAALFLALPRTITIGMGTFGFDKAGQTTNFKY